MLQLGEQLGEQLEKLLKQLNDMPVRLRSGTSYDHTKAILHAYVKANNLVEELGCFKERHWEVLMDRSSKLFLCQSVLLVVCLSDCLCLTLCL